MMAASLLSGRITTFAHLLAIYVSAAILFMLAARVGKRLLGLHVDMSAERTANNVGGAVLSLVIFLLAMMLANARAHFDQVRYAQAKEAEAIRQVDAVLQSIDDSTESAAKQPFTPTVSEYIATVSTVGYENARLGMSALDSQAAAITSKWRKIAMDQQDGLQRQYLLEKVAAVEQARQARLLEASQEPSGLFFIGVGLLFFAALLLFDWGAYGRHGVLLGLIFSIAVGSVVCIILELEHPYEGILQVESISSYFDHSGP
jgi:hypothetical protein